jgi:hypothetical protein
MRTSNWAWITAYYYYYYLYFLLKNKKKNKYFRALIAAVNIRIIAGSYRHTAGVSLLGERITSLLCSKQEEVYATTLYQVRQAHCPAHVAVTILYQPAVKQKITFCPIY